MLEWTIIALLTIAVIYQAKRLVHLEKIVRWVEIRSNTNAININAISAMYETERCEATNPELSKVKISEMKAAIRHDTESANYPLRDRNEHLRSLGVASEHKY